MKMVDVVAELISVIPNMHRPAYDRCDADRMPNPNGAYTYGGCKYLANTGEKCWIGQLLRKPISNGHDLCGALDAGGRRDVLCPDDVHTDSDHSRWRQFLLALQGFHDSYSGDPGEDFHKYLRASLKEMAQYYKIPTPDDF